MLQHVSAQSLTVVIDQSGVLHTDQMENVFNDADWHYIDSTVEAGTQTSLPASFAESSAAVAQEAGSAELLTSVVTGTTENGALGWTVSPTILAGVVGLGAGALLMRWWSKVHAGRAELQQTNSDATQQPSSGLLPPPFPPDGPPGGEPSMLPAAVAAVQSRSAPQRPDVTTEGAPCVPFRAYDVPRQHAESKMTPLPLLPGGTHTLEPNKSSMAQVPRLPPLELPPLLMQGIPPSQALDPMPLATEVAPEEAAQGGDATVPKGAYLPLMPLMLPPQITLPFEGTGIAQAAVVAGVVVLACSSLAMSVSLLRRFSLSAPLSAASAGPRVRVPPLIEADGKLPSSSGMLLEPPQLQADISDKLAKPEPIILPQEPFSKPPPKLILAKVEDTQITAATAAGDLGLTDQRPEEIVVDKVIPPQPQPPPPQCSSRIFRVLPPR